MTEPVFFWGVLRGDDLEVCACEPLDQARLTDASLDALIQDRTGIIARRTGEPQEIIALETEVITLIQYALGVKP